MTGSLFLGALLLAAAPTATTPAAHKAEPPSAAQLKAANDTLSLLVSAFNSTDVPQPTKNALFVCLYEVPLRTISAAETELLAGDKKIDASDPTQRLLALTTICHAPVPGVDTAKPGAAKPGAAKPAKAKPSSAKPKAH